MRGNSFRIALGGLLSAAAVALMFLGSILPFMTFAVPAAASLSVLFFVLEYGKALALVPYLTIGFLGVFLVPDKEVAFLFLLLFGHYPILKNVFESRCSNVVAWGAKFLSFNTSLFLLYWILLSILQLNLLTSEFSGYTLPMLFGMLAAGNIVFLFFDIALTRLITQYIHRIRPKLTKTPPR